MVEKPLPSAVDEAARILWNYHRLNQAPSRSDVIIVACSHDLRVADYAVQLWKEDYARWLLFSGGMAHQGDLLETGWNRPEADVFAERALDAGIPAEAILRECEATNTGENVVFSRDLLQESAIRCRSVLLVQKPYMERRAWATARAQCPEWDLSISSPSIAYGDYPDYQQGITAETLIHLMVGDLQRIRDYPAKGYQIHQDIPNEVAAAYKALVKAGFDGHSTGE